MTGSALSNQVGAALGAHAFAAVGPAGVVAVRQWVAAAVLLPVARPPLRRMTWAQWWPVLLLGVVYGAMNLGLYTAVDRIGLGLAVTLEFLGPLAVATIGSRRKLDLLWVALAGIGVALLAGGAGGLDRTLGLVLAALAGLCWAFYITLSVPVGRLFPGATGLAPAMFLGALLIAPWGIASARAGLRDPQILGAAVGVGLLSSALPWSLELEALRRLPTHVFGVVLALEPVIAALMGSLFLREHLGARSWVAIGLVVTASAGAALEISRVRTEPPEA